MDVKQHLTTGTYNSGILTMQGGAEMKMLEKAQQYYMEQFTMI